MSAKWDIFQSTKAKEICHKEIGITRNAKGSFLKLKENDNRGKMECLESCENVGKG